MRRYNPKEIEPKWQKIWDETGTYTADLQSKKPKYIAMSMFNYPSGAGIHIGHAMNYTISDVKARFKRQQGFESYHPVGWDAFGLPAENYAIKSGVSPQESMANIIPGYHKQYKAMGWSNDWEKEIATHLPEYYKWTQWIFSEMYRNGLAYQDSRLQWWCPIDKTVLANEQVIDGKCWRHDGPNDPPAEKREVKQWFFKITDYADELLEAIDDLDWTESVKLAQINWIGKSVGAEIDFGLDFGDEKVNARTGEDGKRAHITVFTTRPDTVYGATYLVLAPDHKWVELALGHKNVLQNNDEVSAYVQSTEKKTEVERQADKEKTGVELKGVVAINPATGERIPIWIADYVLSGYGTGAIMAVPAHDERDFEFAKKFALPIKQVVMPIADDTKNPPRAGFEDVRRDTVIVHLKDKSTGKYAVLDWHESLEGITTAIMGGIDPGEEAAAAATREIAEEVGLHDVKIVKKLHWITGARYCASHKQQNRTAIATGMLAEVENLGGQTAVDENETKNHTIAWVDENEVLERLVPAHQKQVWQLLHEETALIGEGELLNSGSYDGLPASEAREKIVADLEKKGFAKEKVNYRMNDWSVSRQRYWGAPIPIIHCEKCGAQLVPDEALPVVLPELDDYAPTGDGRSALARAKDWLEVQCPNCGGKAERETDTLDTYICSSWYFYRYMDPHNQQRAFDPDIVKKWEPIDFYNGADHATAHLLYARFIGHFFKKLGLVNEAEPFKQFLFNGKVTAHDGQMFSKSKGNGIDPLEIIGQGYGADALRTYLMFASPLELWTRWDSQGVPGAYRFLNRVWNLVQEFTTVDSKQVKADNEEVLRAVHPVIKKVTEDIEENHYNTAIAAMMGLTNELYKLKERGFEDREVWQFALESLVALAAPFAPHAAEELWHELGHSTSVHINTWPKYDEKYLVADTMTIAVQVNGKLRAQIELPANADEAAVKSAAEANDKVKAHVDGKEIVKSIYVQGKILNLVVK